MTRILVADDHEVLRTGLKSIVETHPGWQVVAEAADGKEAVVKARETNPDVAILDYAMPVMNGVEAARQIRKSNAKIEVLIFTVHDSEVLVRDALAAGARAYLLKSDAKQHLISAIEALSAHQPFFTGQVSEKLLNTYFQTQHGSHQPVLSARERIVVQLIAEGRTNREASSILNLSIKTIETHRAAAMRKLNITSTAGIVRYAVRNNLIEP